MLFNNRNKALKKKSTTEQRLTAELSSPAASLNLISKSGTAPIKDAWRCDVTGVLVTADVAVAVATLTTGPAFQVVS
jgi:hypothetical protein